MSCSRIGLSSHYHLDNQYKLINSPTWKYMEVHGSTCNYMQVHGSTCNYMQVHASSAYGQHSKLILIPLQLL